MGISERLKEERARLGLTQSAMADLIGATKRSVINWEGGTGSPNAEAMAAIAAAGADVQYILTGVRAGDGIAHPTASYTVLTPREAALVDNYRHIDDEEGKRYVERSAQLAATAHTDEAQSINKKAG